jgi:hypothetical protein
MAFGAHGVWSTWRFETRLRFATMMSLELKASVRAKENVTLKASPRPTHQAQTVLFNGRRDR